jgi:hypothetical protein
VEEEFHEVRSSKLPTEIGSRHPRAANWPLVILAGIVAFLSLL